MEENTPEWVALYKVAERVLRINRRAALAECIVRHIESQMPDAPKKGFFLRQLESSLQDAPHRKVLRLAVLAALEAKPQTEREAFIAARRVQLLGFPQDRAFWDERLKAEADSWGYPEVAKGLAPVVPIRPIRGLN